MITNTSLNKTISEMKTVVLAEGKGTRLGKITKTIPKPMVLVRDSPIIEHILKNNRRYGFTNFLFKTAYLSEQIENHFDDGSKWNCKIKYLKSEEPTGTAGRLNFLKNEKYPVVIMYGDVLVNFNLRKMLNFHIKKEASATIVVHKSNHPEDSDVAIMNEDSTVSKLIHKPGNREFGNITNAALYILNPECFSEIPEQGLPDFGKEIIPKLIEKKYRVFGYNSEEYMKDVGTPERLEEAERDIDLGKVFVKVEAVFLDRDGTINKEVNLLHKKEDFELLNQSSEAISIFNKNNIISVVTTNQPVVARGLCNEKEVQEINELMIHELDKMNAYVDEIYYCPHHPEQHPYGNQEFRIPCECRKPGIGMVMDAKNKFNLSLKNCFLIGDTTTDIKTAKNAGCRSILVKSGYGGSDKKHDVTPDYEFADLKDAALFIEKYNNTTFMKICEDIKEKLEKQERVVVVLGGCSRTGKTTLTNQIIKKVDSQTKVVLLDNWLIDFDKRKKDNKVFERYDYKKIQKDINAFLKGEAIEEQEYDAKTRMKIGKKRVKLLNERIILIEGVVALDIPLLRKVADVTIYKDELDETRKKRLKEYFKDRNMTEKEKLETIENRELEEVKYVKNTTKYAEYIF